MSDTFDIVIIGAGPVGLTLAAAIRRTGPYTIKIIDTKPDPTLCGRASGVQGRTLDFLENMGLKSHIMTCEPGKVFEVAFWNPSEDGEGIRRTSNAYSYPDFIDTRYHHSTIIHQGHIERILLEDIAKSSIKVDRPCTFSDFRMVDDNAYPVQADLKSPEGNTTVRAKYLFGADGARSLDPVTFVWSVIDGVVKTDFPDIGIKCTIHSKSGSSMIIPEGRNRTRIYVQLQRTTDPNEELWSKYKQEDTQKLANKIFSPYKIEWEEVDWWSMYPIGQRLAEHYTDRHRVFIGGDACHTHSPKAGQGMNYGMFDAQNFAWKFHQLQNGFAAPSLLDTYEQERRKAANQLLDFDIRYARLFSSRPEAEKEKSKGEETEFMKLHRTAASFTSGYEVNYGTNGLNWSQPAGVVNSKAFDPTGVKLVPGRTFPTCSVTRVIDAHPCELDLEVPFNGAWRIYIFAGDVAATGSAMADLESRLAAPASFLRKHAKDTTLTWENRHGPQSSCFTFSLVYCNKRSAVELNDVARGFFAPYRFHIYADDISASGERGVPGRIYEKMGFDKVKGGVAIVRPDNFVACCLSLEDGAVTADAINEYFQNVGSTVS
ncbi:hypothetical protein K491DRAFT_706444 [Lophiostoma macrostomum CBS 122681]|uniref:Phenol 2-monooxygenase n=1 Tax=Lophiostoma macrostomum CBS 122681 TaxID=1314788 RepID=A0A6A6SXX8_9PLEO|nr:hypothetical protein K491DRAFT_706444 [Lophiostoma macrostomum CBS 122681]